MRGGGAAGRGLLRRIAIAAVCGALMWSASVGAPAGTAGTGWLGPSPAVADVAPSTVSYHPAYATPTVLQTFEIIGNANAAGGDGTYRLTDGTRTTAPIHHQADLSTFVAALEAAGFTVADASGGTGLATWTGGTRWNVTFAADPGTLLAPLDIAFARTFVGYTFPGVVKVDCIYCVDVYAPTGPSNGAAIVLVHPGALTTGSKDWTGLTTLMDPFRAAGYTAAVVNHRLAALPPGGSATCEIDTVFPPDSPCDRYVRIADEAGADVQLAAQWLTDNAATFALTPGKVVTMGVSSGGTVAAHSLYVPVEPGHRRPLAAFSIGGALRDRAMTAGAPPLLLGTFTADPAIVYTGTDTYEEAQEAIARARTIGTTVEARVWLGPGHVPEPVLGVFLGTRDTRPEAADMAATGLAFFATNLFGAPARPSHQWFGAAPPFTFSRSTSSQSLFRRTTEDVRAIRGDFDGNGRGDILWYGAGAAYDTLWLGRADGTFTDAVEVRDPVTGALGYFPIARQDGAFTNVSVGDFDGNGRDDVLFSGPSVELWRFGLLPDNRPTVVVPASPPGDAPDPASPVIVADLDHDLRDDVLWYGVGTGADHLWYGNADGTFGGAGGPLAVTGPAPGAVPVIGDYDGDGHADAVWHAPGAAAAETVWWGGDRTEPVTEVPVAPSTSWDTGAANHVVAGDFDGDARTDLLAIGNGYTPDVLVRGTADRMGSRQAVAWLGGATPIVLDVDGNGRSDVLWYVPGAAIAALWYGGASGFTTGTTVVGRSGTPLVGRFNGYPATPSLARDDLFWS